MKINCFVNQIICNPNDGSAQCFHIPFCFDTKRMNYFFYENEFLFIGIGGKEFSIVEKEGISKKIVQNFLHSQ